MWNSIGNIVIFRSQGYLFYYLGTVGFQMAYAVERLIACYSLRRKLRKQQIRVEPDTIVKEDVKSDESDMVKQVEEGAAVNAFEPNRLRRVTLVKRPTIVVAMSRRSSRKDDVGRSHYSKRDSHVSDNDSVVSGIPLGVRAAGFNEEELPDYPPARTERGDVQLPLTEEETTIINLQAGDDESDLFGMTFRLRLLTKESPTATFVLEP
ncbi:hypothetical protein BC829DRAFT_207485 [Chytridium lagenaria]|nr:hypothetical protein BC829DRAFT_207485 [Chytridium lagenaria]